MASNASDRIDCLSLPPVVSSPFPNNRYLPREIELAISARTDSLTRKDFILARTDSAYFCLRRKRY
jgi:hypothetical protein